jgi:hypothetical protein
VAQSISAPLVAIDEGIDDAGSDVLSRVVNRFRETSGRPLNSEIKIADRETICFAERLL